MDGPGVFSVLSDLKAAILANDTAAIRAGLSDLDAIASRMNTSASAVGNNMRLIDQMQEHLRSSNLGLQEHISSMTDADLAKSITDMSLTNQALNLTMSSQAQVQQLSLLDFLR
jgi:flagellin-like hook-associated protein FlgL